MKKRKTVFKAVTFLVLLAFSGTAFASTYSANAGIANDNSNKLSDKLGREMEQGYLVEYINLKNGYIYGPTNEAGSVNGKYEDVRPAVNIVDTQGQPLHDREVGYVSTDGTAIMQEDEPVIGKFWHQVSADGTTTQAFIVRAWEGSNPTNAQYFGESIVFYSQDDPMLPPLNTNLNSFSTIFPKEPPSMPGNFQVDNEQGSGNTVPPQIIISFNSVLGARNYQVQLSRNGEFASTDPIDNDIFVDDTSFYKDQYHSLYIGASLENKTRSYNLNTDDQTKTIYCRVRAINSFGNSDWIKQSTTISKNSDPTTPVAVTDLQATLNGSSITLTWTAPWDQNESGDVAACASYDIKVSTEAIVDEPTDPFNPARTNPGKKSTWVKAQSIDTYFASTIPAPQLYPALQTLTIPNVDTSKTYYFAIKATDAEPHVSYISNVAGVGALTAEQPPVIVVNPNTFEVSYVFEKTGNLGINQFSIPFDVVTYEAAAGFKKPIANMRELVDAITVEAGSIITTVGWWDKTNQQMVGWVDVNNTPAAQNGAPAALSSEQLTKDKVYQMSVIQGVTFKLSGIRD